MILAKQIHTVNNIIKMTNHFYVLPQNYILLCTEITYSISPGLSLTDAHMEI